MITIASLSDVQKSFLVVHLDSIAFLRPPKSFSTTMMTRPSSSLSISPVDEESDKYGEYPLLRSLLINQTKRNAALQWEGRHQIEFPQSNEGWWKTIWMVRGRGIDYLIWPWSLCVLHSIAYVVAIDYLDMLQPATTSLSGWEVVFT